LLSRGLFTLNLRVAVSAHVISTVGHLRLNPNVKIMKPFLFFLLLVFFTLPAFGQKKYREVDLRVSGIGSGTSYSTVVRKLGKPLRSKKERYAADSACSGAAETHLTLFYSGLEITLLGDGRGRNLDVYSIEVTSKKWVASGISIGASIKNILNKFNEPNSKADISGETVLYYVTKENLGGVNFYFRNNKLVRVAMTETLC